MKSARIDKDRAIQKLEKKYNDEIEELENLLYEVQQKLQEEKGKELPGMDMYGILNFKKRS